ncbi:ABC transporter ATP-binding protein [Corynebacterium auriscanis]|uniref:ABC transporter ATP-binding protein n=1 Tax=Corynebacterium auriscanis TaxID=99807 RepID=UPI002247D0E8|nr:ABC transporter ATP-binding protein [Corynebacterium auriscanis]MCX2162654.1 ABC transporter ATP-binding protein [Corynebacterium auriscanis]
MVKYPGSIQIGAKEAEDFAPDLAVRASEIDVTYSGRPVLRGVNISVPDSSARKVIGLVGPNGSGKSTLLKALLGAVPIASGVIELQGRPLKKMKRSHIARHIAMVSQNDRPELPILVHEFVMLGRLPHTGIMGPAGNQDLEITHNALAQVGATSLSNRSLQELSGGELQRVLIARAVAQSAEVMLLDEPTNHLDIKYQHEVLGLLHKLKMSSLVVLHDLNLAAAYCHEVYIMNAGRIVAHGSPLEILTPDILEPIYGVRIRDMKVNGQVQLLFQPKDSLEDLKLY